MNTKRKNSWKWLGLSTLLLALVFRLIFLDKIPQLFDGDEADLGYNAYALLSRGTDEYGVKLPLYFSSLGDFQYPAYVYLSTVWVKVFGLNEFSTRLTSALAGVVGIALLSWTITFTTKRINLGLVASAILSLSPWHVFLSRKALEGNLGLTLTLLIAAIFLRFIKKDHWTDLVAVFLISLVGIYTYPATRFFIIAGMLVLSLTLWWVKKYKPAGVGILIVLIGVGAFISPESRFRGNDISIYSTSRQQHYQSLADLELHSAGLVGKIPTPLTRLYSNKYVLLAKELTYKYVDQFNPAFYFTRGDDRPRYALRGTGFITFSEAFLILTGLFFCIQIPSKLKWLGLVWLLLAAVPSALTTENPHAVRLALALPPLALLAAFGAGHIKNRLVWLVIIGMFTLHWGYILYQNVVQKYYNQPWEPEYRISEMTQMVYRHKDNYHRVLVPGDPYIFLLFHNRIDPQLFWSRSDISPDRIAWDRVNSFGNIIFKAPGICPTLGKVQVAYVCPGYLVPQNAKLIDYVAYADGVPAYSLIEFFPAPDYTPEELPNRFIRMPDVNTKFGPAGLLPDDWPTYWL